MLKFLAGNQYGKTAKMRELYQRVHEDLLDSFDEGLEMELDDEHLEHVLTEAILHLDQQSLNCQLYFRELFRLQVNWSSFKTGSYIKSSRWS